MRGSGPRLHALLLAALGPVAAPVVPALVEKARAGGAREEAIAALSAIGPAAREAVPTLRDLALDWDPDVRRAAGAALRRIEGE